MSERFTCRHGARLDAPCEDCEKTPGTRRTWLPSDDLDGLPLGTAEEERQHAKNWMDTAARHCRNEEYYRAERGREAALLLACEQRLGEYMKKVESLGLELAEVRGFAAGLDAAGIGGGNRLRYTADRMTRDGLAIFWLEHRPTNYPVSSRGIVVTAYQFADEMLKESAAAASGKEP